MKLEARGVKVAIRGRAIVAGASLTLEPGEVVGLIGPNGAGKSTLLKALVGVRGMDSGEVLLDGKSVAGLRAKERARHIAYLPQDRRVEWRLPVRDVVMLGRYPHHAAFGGPTLADHQAAERALASVDAAGLESRIATSLSGGELARVLLARTLAVEAPILIADEPIAALDVYHQLHVMEIMRAEAGRGVGVLVVLHDLTLAARFCDRIILMSDADIVAEGPPGDVLTAERLAQVYRVAALRGTEGREPWLLAWTRTDAGPGAP